ncbi:uncharacterized protein LOC108912251 [Anoplophora glabripennis]|uniref:uncharacterized protein LOC108912251 n=1 Tax=Anoplophora glabripennis TaxID=217634 RepID=UPI000874DCB1|nr:uncharacterized protein LOC108912251 [Anoplophora glabripennis]
MVVLDASKENFVEDTSLSIDDESLQEERRRTGRYLAAGIVIFLVGLGLYHAVVYGSTRLSALLGASLIMFLYLLWLLYASQRKKKLLKTNELALQQHIEDVIIKSTKSSENLVQVPGLGSLLGGKPSPKKNNLQVFNRSYSIA